jgi:hypothetical protein
MTLQQERSWRVHDEQHLGSFGRGSLKRVSGDLPDGVSFDQYVILLPQSVTVAAVDSAGAVLMVRRHRFILDRWVCELPGGYVEEGEDLDVAAVAALEMTAPPYEWATRTIGPSTVRRSASRYAASLPSSRSGFASPIVSRCGSGQASHPPGRFIAASNGIDGIVAFLRAASLRLCLRPTASRPGRRLCRWRVLKPVAPATPTAGQRPPWLCSARIEPSKPVASAQAPWRKTIVGRSSSLVVLFMIRP